MKQSLEMVTNASPGNLVGRILAYASRPLTEFNKYEALEMLETLQNKATVAKHDKTTYYQLVYQTAKEKVETSKSQFKSLVMHL